MSNLAELQDGQYLHDAPLEIQGEIYNIQERIGSGGMAFVYRTLDAKGKRMVVKAYKSSLRKDVYQEITKGFDTRRQHPYVPNNALVYPHAGTASRAVVYDYVEGEPAYYDGMRKIEDRIREARMLLAKTMPTLHILINNGLIHRDMKPGNLLVWPGNEGVTVLDSDFLIEISRRKTSNLVFGTPLYYAPEQAAGEESATTDVFGLGATITYELMDYETKAIIDLGDQRLGANGLMISRQLSSLTEQADTQRKLLDLSRFPEDVRTEAHGLICALIAMLQPDPAARPKTLKEVMQLLSSTPNVSMHYGP